MYDLCAMGELLIDFTPNGVSLDGNSLFEANPGGAPANVLAALAGLGGQGAFIGQVGNDRFGTDLLHTLEALGIDTSGLVISEKHHTTLAFVHLDENGERSFSFCRENGADCMMELKQVNMIPIKNAKIFHFGSLSLTNEPVRTATLEAVAFAKSSAKIISFDPNYRAPLWKSVSEAAEWMLYGLKMADIVKLSKEEMELLTKTSDLSQGTQLLQEHGIRLVIVTLGGNGCFYRRGNDASHLSAYNTQVVDTTGAGDVFTGALLERLCRYGVNTPTDIDAISKEKLEEFLDFANAAGAVCVSKRGAIPSVPDIDEIRRCIRAVEKNETEEVL